MQFQDASTLHTRSQARRTWLAAAAGAALVAATAVGTWQTVARREGTTTTAIEQTTASTASTSAARHDVPARSDTLTVYVVGSADEAERLRDSILAQDQILAHIGQPPFAAQVVVAATPEEEDSIAWAYAEADAIRSSLGLPPITVINLRSR